jgi:APA family basic amino acid/polyamine antiporter
MTQQPSLRQSMGLLDGTMIVAGSMIGSGIFIVSADMTRLVGSGGWLILLWVLTGIMTVFAAVSYGELSSMFPKAGGQYVYLKEAFNPLTGFLYGWSFFTVIQTGTIAAVGVAFSKFAGYFIPALTMDEKNMLFDAGGGFKIYPAQLVSIALVIFLTWVNTRGVKEGKLVQRIFTLAKLLAIFGLIIFGFLLAADADIWNSNWSSGFDLQFTQAVKDEAGKQIGWSAFQEPSTMMMAIGLIASAMVGSVFSSVAWENVTFIAGEIRNPKRNVGLSLFLGTLIVTIVYVLTNVMYVSVLPLTPPAGEAPVVYPTEAAGNIAFAVQDRVATAVSTNIFGANGTLIIAIMIMVSTFGCNNGLILSGARVYYTMAKDGLFLRQAAQLNKNDVPGWALWAQCIWTSLLCLSGQYGTLLNYVVFITLLFYILTILGIFRLRRTRPDAERPYKAFGYPVVPIIYCLLAGTMAVGLIYAQWQTSVFGLGILLVGIPVYYLSRKKQTPSAES